MPNIKSAKKRVKVIEAKTLQNQMIKTAVKTYIKKFETVVESGDVAAATSAFSFVVKKLDQAAGKGIYHKNMVARKKSQLATKLASLNA